MAGDIDIDSDRHDGAGVSMADSKTVLEWHRRAKELVDRVKALPKITNRLENEAQHDIRDAVVGENEHTRR